MPASTPTVLPHLCPIVILGPTAGGKSELAVRLAEAENGEIIGADSIQVYRHLDAGSAKPTHDQRRRAKHHLIDIVEPTVPFTVADWIQLADQHIADLQSRGVRPIVVGGTNLYLKSLLEGMFEGPGRDDAFRESLNDVATADLHARLKPLDPAAGERLHPNDRKRLIRALEVHHLTGRPISDFQQQWDQSPDGDKPNAAGDVASGAPAYRHSPLLVGLRWSPEAVNPRINLRVKAMFHPDRVEPKLAADVCINGESLPDETRRLEAADLLGSQAREALGYRQVLDHLAGRMSLDDAMERTKIDTRRFAKQQRTWLKRFRGVHWLEADAQTPDGLFQAACDALES